MTQELEHSLKESELPAKLEHRVRALDDPRKPINVMSEELAELLGKNIGTIKQYISVKRRGHKSLVEYRNGLARKQGFDSYNRMILERSGLETHTDIEDQHARNIDWDITNYHKWRTVRRKKLLIEGKESNKQIRFETSMIPIGPYFKRVAYDPIRELESREIINRYLERCIDEKEREIIEMRAEGMDYRTIAKKAGLTREGVRQLVWRIYREMREKLI